MELLSGLPGNVYAVRILLITNPYATASTPGAHGSLADQLRCHEQVESVDVIQTTHRGHATELGATAAKEQYDAVIVHGGDGSVNETVNGMLGSPDRADRPGPDQLPVLGVIPAGNANVFARALGMHHSSARAVDQLLGILSRGERRTVSLGHTLNRWFLFNAGMGMDAIVIRRMEEQRLRGSRGTNVRYLLTAISSFFSSAHPSPVFTVEVSEREPIESARFAFVSNTSPWTYLGPLPIRTNPGTDFDHGLGLVAATTVSPGHIAWLGAQLLVGRGNVTSRKLYRNDDLGRVVFRSEHPADVQMDGDYLGLHRELEFSYAPGVLTVLAPSERSSGWFRHRAGGSNGR